MASTDYKFEGWLGHDADSVNGNMKWGEFEPKKWTEDDVDIQITHCGICGSDLHTLSAGWGATPFRKSSSATASKPHQKSFYMLTNWN